MGWYNASWTYRQKITVDNTKVSASLSNFPVYLDLSQLSSGFFSHVQSSGADIRITTSDGETEVPREVVSVDTSNSKGEVHFKAGSLSGSADTEFYIYYGNSGASEPAEDATYGKNNVWTDYKFVLHAGNTTSINSLSDSTENGLTISTNGSMTDSDIVDGKIGKAIEFDGSNDWLDVGSNDTFDLAADQKALWQCWAKQDANNLSFSHLFGHEGTRDENTFVRHKFKNTGAIQFELRHNSGGGSETVDAATPEDNTDYHLIHFLRAYNGNDTIAVVVDGVATTDTDDTGKANDNMSNPLTIGAGIVRSGVPNSSTYFGGTIGEVRIMIGESISLNRATTEYNNQNSPSTFYTIGSEETDGGGGTTFTPKVIMF